MVTRNSDGGRKALMAINKRLDRMLERAAVNYDALLGSFKQFPIIDEIAEVGAKRAPARGLEVAIDETGDINIGLKTGAFRSLHPNGAQQLGTRLGLPPVWTREMAMGDGWQREMIADNFATVIANTTKSRVLLRSTRDQVRGVLSDRYRRMNSQTILKHFHEAVSLAGAIPLEVDETDLRWSLKAVLPEPMKVDLPNHGEEWIAGVVRLAHSDFGFGALSIDLSILRLVCSNGMIGENCIRKVHLGSRLGIDIKYADETYEADTKAMALAVRDTTNDVLRQEKINETIEKMREAAGHKIEDTEKEVAGLVRARRIQKGEGEAVTKKLMERDGGDVPAGPITRWSLAQAVSHLAGETDNADRRRDLEATAGELAGLRTAESRESA